MILRADVNKRAKPVKPEVLYMGCEDFEKFIERCQELDV